MPRMLDAFRIKLEQHNEFDVIERLELPPRAERRTPVPSPYRTGAVGRWLLKDEALKGNLWLHQAFALEAFSSGRNVVLSTGTASGKSLVFQAATIKTLEADDEARVLVFYPLKALAADQDVSWRRALKRAGLPTRWVASVTGDVLPAERKAILEQARIVIATPDVCHAWLMRALATRSTKRFLASLRLMIVDEAHVFDAVFGSNAAFLIRRLEAAARICQAKKQDSSPFAVIAASATIANPREHLYGLTGLDFTVVDEVQDGSPQRARTLLHLAYDPHDAQGGISNLQRDLIEHSDSGSFITFADSRQGIERLASNSQNGDSGSVGRNRGALVSACEKVLAVQSRWPGTRSGRLGHMSAATPRSQA